MPWTKIIRPHYARDGLGYASGTTDAESDEPRSTRFRPERAGRGPSLSRSKGIAVNSLNLFAAARRPKQQAVGGRAGRHQI